MILTAKQYSFIAGFLIMGLLLASCDELGGSGKVETTIETAYYELDIIIKETLDDKFQMFTEEVLPGKLQGTLADAGFDDLEVSEVLLKEAGISLVEADNYENLDVLRYVEITIYTDKLGEDPLAWLNPVPGGQSSIDLEKTAENILKYFDEDSFMLTAQGYLNERIRGNFRLKAKVKFLVKGTI